MRFFNVKSTVIAILFIPAALLGQEAVYSHRTGKRSFIAFTHSTLATKSNSNAILLQLATTLDESPRRLTISVDYSEMIEVKAPAMKSPEVLIRFEQVRTCTSPSYRGFSTEDILTPDLASCNLNLIDLPDSTVLRQFKLTNLNVRQLQAGYLSSEIPVLDPGKFAVVLSNVTFQYSDAALAGFRERINLINNYFAASALIDSLLLSTRSYNPLTTNDLPEKYILLMEINRIVRLIGNHRFREQLSLYRYDPEHVAEKFLQLDKFSRSATMTFEQQIREPGPVRWDGNLDRLVDIYISHLVSYLHRSMLLNGIRGGIYREYTDSYFRMRGFSVEEELFHGLMQKLYPGRDPVQSASIVAQVLWQGYLQEARRQIRASDFQMAILLLDHAVSFRSVLPNTDLEDYVPLQQEAVKGVYASFLGIAESCIELEKFQMAEDYISQAGEYLAAYAGVIPADTMFQRVFRKLFNRRLQGCDFILGEKQYQEALDCYQLFSFSYPREMIAYVEDHLVARRTEAIKGLYFIERDRVSKQMSRRETDEALASYDKACLYQELIPSDPVVGSAHRKLSELMLPVRYRQLADRGTYYYLTYNHEEAFQTFTRMREVGETLGLQVDTALDRMYRESYKHHMLNEISMATGMIWKDELEMAREYVREVESVMDLYNLEQDADLQSALNSYRQKIDLKVCLSVKEESDFLAIRAWKNIELKQFDMAVKQLGEARQKARQHPECEIDIAAYEDTINKYISAAFYQEKQVQALSQVALGNFREALQRVSDNQRFYQLKQLGKFGVPFTSMLDFVAQANRIPMYLDAITYFLENKEPASAWTCLTWLKREGVAARDVRELQERVGRELAGRDFELFQGSDPEERVKSYARGNRWFAKFAEAYTERWYQLQSMQSTKTP